jgi:integrase
LRSIVAGMARKAEPPKPIVWTLYKITAKAVGLGPSRPLIRHRDREGRRAEGRHGARDSLMICLAYHHGLRVSELVGPKGLRWDDVLGLSLFVVGRVG